MNTVNGFATSDHFRTSLEGLDQPALKERWDETATEIDRLAKFTWGGLNRNIGHWSEFDAAPALPQTVFSVGVLAFLLNVPVSALLAGAAYCAGSAINEKVGPKLETLVNELNEIGRRIEGEPQVVLQGHRRGSTNGAYIGSHMKIFKGKHPDYAMGGRPYHAPTG